MTDHEKKAQRAQLYVELEDAASDLAHLREKAICLAQRLRTVAQKVEQNATCQPSQNDFSMEADSERRLNSQEQVALDHNTAAKLIEELKAARQNIYNLELRKASLAQNGSVSIGF